MHGHEVPSNRGRAPAMLDCSKAAVVQVAVFANVPDDEEQSRLPADRRVPALRPPPSLLTSGKSPSGAPLPLSRARTQPGDPSGSKAIPRRRDATPMRRGRSPRSGLWGRRYTAPARCGQQSASGGGIYLDAEETAGSHISRPVSANPAMALLLFRRSSCVSVRTVLQAG